MIMKRSSHWIPLECMHAYQLFVCGLSTMRSSTVYIHMTLFSKMKLTKAITS